MGVDAASAAASGSGWRVSPTTANAPSAAMTRPHRFARVTGRLGVATAVGSDDDGRSERAGQPESPTRPLGGPGQPAGAAHPVEHRREEELGPLRPDLEALPDEP
jgi:hypothetical protein